VGDVPILVCDCGKRLKAPGAAPGRVGRCPACGGLMRVSEVAVRQTPAPAIVADDAADEPPSDEPRPVRSKPRRRKRAGSGAPETATAIWDGLIAAPRSSRGESLQTSTLYPLWGGTGVASLILFPPLLWVTSVPTAGGLAALFGGAGSTPSFLGLLMALPTAMGLFAVLGYVLLFLGRVLAASALGEVHHPRWPDWELSTMVFGVGRWLWAGLVGGAVGGLPAVAYWIGCGDVDFFDLVILGELLAAGAVYGLMALLASVLHEDVAAANPVTVLKAVRAVGWDYLPSCLVAGFSVLVSGTVGLAAFEVESPALAAFLAWLFWVLALYTGMVSLRVLGLCYARHAGVLGWFRGRTGWGV